MQNYWKILVVDDSRTIHRVIMNFLAPLSLNGIDYAPNGQIGLDMVKANKYDLVTMDIDMPVMDGFEASKEILKHNPDQKILILTARQGDHYIVKALEVGICDYMIKPFSAKALQDKVQDIVGKNICRIKE